MGYASTQVTAELKDIVDAALEEFQKLNNELHNIKHQ